MSDEDMKLEQVEADIVEEGVKAVTMEDLGEETNYSYEEENSGINYEETIKAENTSTVFSVISVILGVVSIVCCCTCWGGIIAGLAAVILGVVSLKSEPSAKTSAIVGIVCGSIGLLLGLTGVVLTNTAKGMNDILDRYIDNPDFYEDLKDFGNM